MKLKKNSLIVIVLTIVILGGLYWYFFAGSNAGNAPTLTTTDAQNPDQATFQSLIAELSPISFDTSIFSDPRFGALSDLTTSIAPESLGRSDPFAPVPGITTP